MTRLERDTTDGRVQYSTPGGAGAACRASKPISPIMGTAFLVGDRDDSDPVWFDHIENAVGKAPQNRSAST